MNEFEPDLLEAELQRLKPATPPEVFMSRLATALPQTRRTARSNIISRPGALWRLLRWLAPVTAVGTLLASFVIRQSSSSSHIPNRITPVSVAPIVKADNVEFDQQLVATYYAVAHLPNGEPVRFRCSEWLDDVVLRDSGRGILIQHQMPRLEVEPVSFETY